MFTTEFDRLRIKELRASWGTKIDELIFNGVSKFYVMISYDTGKVVIVSDTYNKSSGLLKFQNEGKIIKIFMHPDLEQEMKTIRHQAVHDEGGCQVNVYF